jgi:hypothetical protein
MLVGPRRVLLMDEISTGLDSATLYNNIQALAMTTHGLELTTVISLLQVGRRARLSFLGGGGVLGWLIWPARACSTPALVTQGLLHARQPAGRGRDALGALLTARPPSPQRSRRPRCTSCSTTCC